MIPRRRLFSTFVVICFAFCPASRTQAQRVIFAEDFEGVELGENVDEGRGIDDPRDDVWSATPPTGWTIDNSLTPEGGVTEFRGWNFVDPVWWQEVAQDQDRSIFAQGHSGVVAVADGDEWDDAYHQPGLMNTRLSTPVWNIEAGEPLVFDSSWRREDEQTAWITASFDVGGPIEILRWNSQFGNPNYHPDGNPENNLTVDFTPPAGASTVQFGFGYQAGDDWWWAIDNIQYGSNAEDFEGVRLDENVFEGRDHLQENAWSETGPPGWTVDDSGVPGFGTDNDGVTEWAGWSFADKTFWIGAGYDVGDRRPEFTKGGGTVAVADPDEWDDAENGAIHPVWADEGYYDALMSTPEIPLEDVQANSLELSFDSSWRGEAFDDGPGPDGGFTNNQTAVLSVSYDGDDPIEILRWESDQASPDFKDDFDPETSTNESVILALENPEGATSMVLTFGLLDAGDDWWWAIDNLLLTAPEGDPLDCDGDGVIGVSDANCATIDTIDATLEAAGLLKGDADGDGSVQFSDFVIFAENFGNPGEYTQGDFDKDGLIQFGDFVILAENFGQSAAPAAAAVPEPGIMLTTLGLLSMLALRRRKP